MTPLSETDLRTRSVPLEEGQGGWGGTQARGWGWVREGGLLSGRSILHQPGAEATKMFV